MRELFAQIELIARESVRNIAEIVPIVFVRFVYDCSIVCVCGAFDQGCQQMFSRTSQGACRKSFRKWLMFYCSVELISGKREYEE